MSTSINPAEILARETSRTSAVERAHLREIERLRRLVIDLCVLNVQISKQSKPVAAAIEKQPDTVAIETELDLSESDLLYKNMAGALAMVINAHGPITTAFIPSAAKRLVGACSVYNHNLKQKRERLASKQPLIGGME